MTDENKKQMREGDQHTVFVGGRPFNRI